MQGPGGTRKKGLILAAAAGAFFSCMAARGIERVGIQATPRPERGVQSSPQVVPFKSERTDSWLCQNVSVFFCSREPGMVTSAPPPTPSSRRRGRG